MSKSTPVNNFTLTLTSPVVEIPLLAKELSGKHERMVIGFSRKSVADGNNLRTLLNLSATVHTPYDDETSESVAKATKEGLVICKGIKELSSFVKTLPTEKEIIIALTVYVRNTHVVIDGTLTKIDTRTMDEGFLPELLTAYCDHPVFYQVLSQGLVVSWNSISADAGTISMDEIKN